MRTIALFHAAGSVRLPGGLLVTRPETRLPPKDRLRAQGAGLSDIGRLRAVNEDAILVDPAGAIWAVADGMGGHGHGEVAAALVIETLTRTAPRGAAALGAAFRAAHEAVQRVAFERGFGQIGATVVVLVAAGARGIVGWAGDSRAYRLRQRRLARLTRDHSLVQEMVDAGRLPAEGAERHPRANVVTRAVGADAPAEPEIAEVGLAPGDRFLLCSDGLVRCVADPAIAAILGRAGDPATAARGLVEATLDAGAPDNVSVVVVDFERVSA